MDSEGKIDEAISNEEEKVSILVADVNGDGNRNSIDFANMRMKLLGMIEEFPVVNAAWASDLDGNRVFNSIDFAYMRQFLLGYRSSFPVEETIVTPTSATEQTPTPTPDIVTTPTTSGSDLLLRPEGLTCAEVGDTTVTLYWEPSNDSDVEEYVIIDNNGVCKGLSNGEITYTVTGLLPNETYEFKVIAMDSNNNVSEPSEPCVVTTKVSTMQQLKMGLIRNFEQKGTSYDLTYIGDATDISNNVSRVLSDAIVESDEPLLLVNSSISIGGYSGNLKISFSFTYDSEEYMSVVRSSAELEQSLLTGINNRVQNVNIIYKGSSILDNIETILDSIVKNDTYLGVCINDASYEVLDSGEVTAVRFDFSYETTKEQEKNVDDAVAFIVSRLTHKDMIDDEKLKLIHDYILTNVDYLDRPECSSVYSALFYGKANCEGYAMLTYKMLKEAGIDNIIVTNEDHAWNVVRINGLWYHVDTTWNDGIKKDYGFYKYYNLTDTQIRESRNYSNEYGITCSSDYIDELNEINTNSGGKYENILKDICDTEDYVFVNRFKSNASLNLLYDEVVIKDGESISLVDHRIPAEIYENSYSWSSSEPDLVSISNGMITAKKEGIVFISAKPMYDMFFTSSLFCRVRVVPTESWDGAVAQSIETKDIVGFTDSSVQLHLTINSEDDVNSTTTVTNAIDTLDGKVAFIGEPVSINTTSEFNWAEIGFKISEEQLENTDINNLVIYWYDDDTGTIVPQATKIDEENGKIFTTVTHFSTYFVGSSELQKKTIDIAIVIDSIYSNQASLDTFKTNITKTIKELRNKANIRLSFIDNRTYEKICFCYVTMDFQTTPIEMVVNSAFDKIIPIGRTPQNEEILAVVDSAMSNGKKEVNSIGISGVKNSKYVLVYTRWDAYFVENNSILVKMGDTIGLVVGNTVGYYSGGAISYNQSDTIPLTEFLLDGNYSQLLLSNGGDSKWLLKEYGNNIRNDVIVLQKMLVALGYLKMPIDPDTNTYVPFGTYASITKEAVQLYQRYSNLYADGIVGKDTWLKLSLPWDYDNAQPDRSSWSYNYILQNDRFYTVIPQVILHTPADGTEIQVGDSIKITAKGTNCHHLALFINGTWVETEFGNINNTTAIDFEYDFVIPETGIYTIQVKGRNVPGSGGVLSVSELVEVEGYVIVSNIDGQEIGSEEYIDMINELYNDAFINKYWYILFSQRGFYCAIDCLKKIMEDVKSNSSKLDYIPQDSFERLCRKINELVSECGSVDKELHYFRNYLNRAPETLDDIIQVNKGLPAGEKWRLLDAPSQSMYHMYDTDFCPEGEYNLKFVSANGYFEAVYNKEGILLTQDNDGKNMGTYNYADPEGGITGEIHFIFDVNTYYKWGNTPNDPYPGNGSTKANVDNYEANEHAQRRHNMIYEAVNQSD